MQSQQSVRVSVCDLSERIDTCGTPIRELILMLQEALELVPEEYRDAATISFDAYDWGGIECEYIRPPTAEEQSAAAAIFADRERLIRETARPIYEEWVRKIRIRTGMSRLGAVAYIATDDGAVIHHPNYNFQLRMVLPPDRIA